MKNRTLRFQMMIVLFTMLIIMIVFGRVIYGVFEKQYSARLLEMSTDVAEQYAHDINTRYMAYQEALESFAYDSTVNRFLSTDSDYEKLTLIQSYDNLQLAYKKMNPGLYSIVLLKKDGTIFSDTSGGSSVNVASTAPAFDELQRGMCSALIIESEKAYIAIMRDVYQSGEIRKKVGGCMFVITARMLTNNPETADSEAREIFIIDENLRIISGNTHIAVGSLLPENYRQYLSGDSLQSQSIDNDYIAVSRTISSPGWMVLCITPRSVVFSELNGIKYTTYILILCMLLLVSAIYLLQGIRLSKAFSLFTEHIDAIAEGRDVAPIKLHSSAEFHRLAKAFNRMMKQLETLNANNLEYHERILMQDIENKQSQLLALQTQINPHFLYNTLECINSAGAICGSREVEEMTTALAYLFRYACKGSHIVRLQDELNSLQYYLSIQEIRFPEHFSVSYDIPANLMNCSVLKFLLQPIVENSIQHGFHECEGHRRICISAALEAQDLLISIVDNGTGMSEIELMQLQERLDSPNEDLDRVGLNNIQRRIRLYYSEVYGLQIKSRAGEGTSVIARLPAVEFDYEREKIHV